MGDIYMRKVIFIFLIIFILISSSFILVISVNHKNKVNILKRVENISSNDISEQVLPIRDNDGVFLGLDIVITIPKNYSSRNILVNPSIFDGINEYKNIMPGDNFIINLKIVNNSNYNYSYLDNSFVLSTNDISYNSQFNTTGALGFDGLNIYENYIPYRTYNMALKALVGDLELSDEIIGDKLVSLGYAGISDLDSYYLDFYNKKYNLNVLKLSDFSFEILRDIFYSDISNYLENNIKIIELSYYYFYNHLIFFGFSSDSVYSIVNYMENNNLDYSLNNYFSIINSNGEKKISNINLSISKYYQKDLYKYYNFFGYCSFVLRRNE